MPEIKEVASKDRKIEAWTGPPGDSSATMIGALIQAADGTIKQIDGSLRKALMGDVPSGPDLAPDLLDRLRSSYPNVYLEFPWAKGDGA